MTCLIFCPDMRTNPNRHCEYLGEDPLQFLVAAQKGDVMVFLEWILDNSKIKKFSSLHENWRQWCQLYRKAVGRSLHAKSCQDINDVSMILPFHKFAF